MTTPLFRIARSAVFLLMAVLLTAGTAFSQVVTTTIGDFQGRPLGQTVSVPVTISDLVSPADDINSFQFTVDDVPGVADYVGYTAGPLSQDWVFFAFGDNITANNTNPPLSQTIDQNGVLLYLNFQLNGEGSGNVGLSSLLYNGTANGAVGGNYLIAIREIFADAAPSPFSSNDYRVGDMVDVPVSLDGMLGVDELAALQFILHFDPAIFDPDINNDGFADITVNDPNYSVFGVVSGSTITFAANQLATASWAGNGPLFTINGQAVGQGTSAFTIDSITATESNANVLILANPPGSLVVGPANQAPSATADSDNVDEDGTLNGNASGTDPEGDPLTFALVTDVANGTLTFNADGSFVYVPDANYNGPDSFTFTVDDSRDTSAPATFSITVNPINDQVTAADVDGGDTDEDTATTVDVKGAVADVEDAPAAMNYTADAVSANGGTVTNNGDGTFTYAPALNFNGTDTFDYTVTDNGDGADPATSATATVTIVVNPINDQVLAADVDGGSTDEDTATSVDVKGAVSDVEDAAAAMTYTGDAVSANGGTVTNNGDGTFGYMPAANWHGTDTFSYTVTDLGDGTDMTLTSASATVTIVVDPVNDQVVALDLNATAVLEDSGAMTYEVLTGVSDVEDAPAAMTYTLGAVVGGTATSDGAGLYTFTPALNFNGVASFEYIVTDLGDGADLTLTSASATVSIVVNPVNDQVVAGDVDGGSTNEDTATSVDVKGAVSDVEDAAAAMTYTADAMSANGGVVTNNGDGTFGYMPAANWHGTDTFSYTVTDLGDGTDLTLTSASATVTIVVDPVNDQVTASNVNGGNLDEDSGSIVVDVKGAVFDVTDLPADMTYTGDAVSANGGTVVNNGDGTFTYTPALNFNGADSFSYTVTDLGDGADMNLTSASATVNILVNAVNDQVLAADVDGGSTDEDTATTVDVKGSVSDVEDSAAAMNYTADAMSANGGVVTNNGDGTFGYMPAANWHGTDTFSYTVTDNGDGADAATSASAMVTIVVNPVNDAPVASDDAYSVDEGEQILVNAPGVLVNDVDISGDGLHAALVSGPAHGTLTLNADGSFVYTHDGSETNSDSFTYVAVDDGVGSLSSNVATIHLTVNAQNDAPVAVDDSGYAVDEDGTLVVSAGSGVRANDSDAEVSNAALTVSLVTGPMYGTLTLNADGSFTYIHGGDEFATGDSFVYELSDGALTAQATATIVINLFNDAPVVDAVADQTITEAETLVYGIVATDAEGATLTYSLAVVPATANASINPSTGVVTFSPSAWDPTELGAYEFTVTVTDGIDETSVSFTVNVTRSLALCDVDMNGLCQAFDATLVLMHRVGLTIPGSSLLPLNDSQLLAADMNTDMSVDAFDASLILRAVVGGKDETPIGDPTGVIAFGAVEQLEGMFRIPVLLSGNSSNLRSLEFILTFDPTTMSVQGIEDQLGERGWLVVHNADNATGKLHIVSAGTVDAVDGELFSIMVNASDVKVLSGLQAQSAMNAAGLVPIGALEVAEIPESYDLSQNYPNPFNPTTTIQYQLPENAAVAVSVYDMQGRLVRMLVETEQSAGTYTVQWDGRNSSGVQVASGIYVYQIRTGAFVATKRMTLVK